MKSGPDKMSKWNTNSRARRWGEGSTSKRMRPTPATQRSHMSTNIDDILTFLSAEARLAPKILAARVEFMNFPLDIHVANCRLRKAKTKMSNRTWKTKINFPTSANFFLSFRFAARVKLKMFSSSSRRCFLIFYFARGKQEKQLNPKIIKRVGKQIKRLLPRKIRKRAELRYVVCLIPLGISLALTLKISAPSINPSIIHRAADFSSQFPERYFWCAERGAKNNLRRGW